MTLHDPVEWRGEPSASRVDPPATPVQPRRRHYGRRIAGGLVVLLVACWFLLSISSESLRRFLEKRVNDALTGYTASIGKVVLHLRDFTVELREVTVVQNAQPRPPVIYVPSWMTHVEWRALLVGKLVATVDFNKPQIYLTPSQATHEMADKTKLQDRGWQDAVTAVYPLDIDHVRINGGAITYFDVGPLKPLALHDVYLDAQNVKNVRSQKGAYPSPVHLTAFLLERGRLEVDGDADFLAKPDPEMRGSIILDDLSLAYLAPLAEPYNIKMQGGGLDANGRFEWAAARKQVTVDDVALTNVKADWIHRASTADAEAARAKKFARAVSTTEKAPAVRVDVARARIAGGELGFVDEAAKPPYRVWIAKPDMTLRGFSNDRDARGGAATIAGRFMDSGALKITSTFRGSGKGPDFDFNVELADVQLRTLNDLLRAHGGFDVAAGRFSFYSEMKVRNGRVDGYVKPLFADMDVYDRKQDRDKNVLQQMYEGVVGGLATVLENHQRDEVATRADLSGPIDDPQASTLEVVLRLLQNAFIKAILPGLERERGRVSER